MSNLYFLTFNCNKILDLGFVQQVSKTYPNEIPNFLLFGFQEICSILDSTDPDTVNKYLILVNELIVSSLQTKYDGVEFTTVLMPHVGAIGMILVTPFPSKFKSIKCLNVSCGISYSSLKGGCGARFLFDGQEYTVVTAHLNANEGTYQWDRRDQNSLRILLGMDFGDGFGVIKPHNHTFFMGDLNYRQIKSQSRPSSEAADEIESLVSNFAPEKDELLTSMKRGSAFWGFAELPIAFKPSYKFYNNTEQYNPKRTPSWCDRILYLKYLNDNEVKVNEYNVVEKVLTSDHHPVFLDIQVPSDAPTTPLIDSHGYLLEDKTIFLKPTWISRFESVLALVADLTIFGGLYLVSTSKGRIILSLVCVLLVVQLWF